MRSAVGYGYTTFVEYYDPQGNDVLRIRNAHQKNLNVSVGDIVNPEDVLGTMDSTGNSTGTHTHWEVWIKINGQWRNVDPLNPIYGITIVGDQSALVPLDGSEPPAIPEFKLPEVELPKVKSIASKNIRIRSKPEVSRTALILNYIAPNDKWDYCGSSVDNQGNTWYAIKKGDKIGWGAALYQGNTWIVPVDDLKDSKTETVKSIIRYPINMRTYPYVNASARVVGQL